MCGIAGVVGTNDGVDTDAMLAALAHRGPDDEGAFALQPPPDASRPAVWLGHRRLAILDPSPAGRQPMHSGDGRFSIVFNGEIYNFRDLCAELGDFEPRTGTDSEVLLELLARDGTDALTRLRGMFAIAVWDAHESRLLLARDRHGEKPLYYVHDPRTQRFLFASEVRSLLASGVVERRLDPDGLDAYLTFGSVVDPFTLVRGVRAVPAGGIVEFTAGAVREGRYWRLADRRVDETTARDDAVARARELLVAAERRCLVADVPVGVLLSGGIDSSVNVALLAATGEASLHTFSVVFGGEDAALSEQPYSSLVAERYGTTHRTCSIGLDDAAGFLDRAVASMDQPSHDGLNSYAVSQAVRAAGVKVAISGQGADELFLGYPQRHRFPALLRRARTIPRPLAALASSIRGRNWRGEDGRHARLATAASARDPAVGAFLAAHGIFSHRAMQQLRGGRRPHPERFVDDVLAAADDADPLERLARLQLRHYLRDTLLRDADQMSMAHGLELRTPYLDGDLVDYVLTVPARHKVEAERNKPLLLDAAGRDLPREVWDRPKRGFSMPVGRWILAGAAPPRRTSVPGLDERAVAAVRGAFATHGRDAPHRYLQAWTLDVLDAWLARHRVTAG